MRGEYKPIFFSREETLVVLQAPSYLVRIEIYIGYPNHSLNLLGQCCRERWTLESPLMKILRQIELEVRHGHGVWLSPRLIQDPFNPGMSP